METTVETTDITEAPRAEVPATFMSRRRNLVLVEVAGREALDALHRTYTIHGTKIEFAEGKFETDNPDTIEWMRSHPRCGDLSDGFFEIEPQAPAPEGEMLDLVNAGTTLDREKVLAILEREHAGWGREIVIATAQATLEAIDETERSAPPISAEDLKVSEDARVAAEERAAAAEARAAALEAAATPPGAPQE